jgi:hypothetical protein
VWVHEWVFVSSSQPARVKEVELTPGVSFFHTSRLSAVWGGPKGHDDLKATSR